MTFSSFKSFLLGDTYERASAPKEEPEFTGYLVPSVVGVPSSTGLSQAEYDAENVKHLQGAEEHLGELRARRP